MKKILHIIGGMDRAGAETFLRNILLNMPRGKYEFGILTFLEPQNGEKYAYQEELEKIGVKFYHIKDTRFTHPLRFREQIAKVVREKHYKIIHSHNDFMSALLLNAAKKGGAKTLISHAHSTSNARVNSPLKRFWEFILIKKLRKVAHIKLACGEAAGEYLYGKKKDFTIIPNGIDLSTFAFNTDARATYRTAHKIGENTIVLLNIGRLETVKNQSFLIDVFEKIASKNPDSALFIVGNGSLKSALKQKIKSSSHADKIFLKDAQPNTSELYSMADYFLLPSLFEGLPMVSVEAQASGLPCFFSKNVSKEANIQKKAVFLPIENPEKWAMAVLSTKKQDLKSRKNAWRSDNISLFDISKSAEKLERIYDAI